MTEPIASITSENKFSAKVYVNVCSDEDVKTFVKAFEEISETYYNMNGGDRSGSKTSLLLTILSVFCSLMMDYFLTSASVREVCSVMGYMQH